MIAINRCLDGIDGAILMSGARNTRPTTYPPMSTSQKLKILLSSVFRPSKPVIHYHREGMVGLDDPLFNFWYTLRFLRTLNPEKLKLPDTIDIPVYVGVGEMDELFAISSVESFADEINAQNKELHVIPGALHAVFPEGSFNHLVEWLNRNFQ